MSASVLVAYTTRTGSTTEVAEAIADTLVRSGFDADLRRMNRVVTLRPYDALILGAPLYIGRFPGEFRSFLLRHKETLSRQHPTIFALGPTRPDPADFEAARDQAIDQLALFRWLNPAEIMIFGGRISVHHLPFPLNLFKHMRNFPLSENSSADLRNWAEIRSWARAMAARFEIESCIHGTVPIGRATIAFPHSA